MLHAFLIFAAGVPQVLLRTQYRVWMPADAKEFPVEYLIGWLLITACSFIGLTLLSFYGSRMEQPALTALCEEDGSIYLSSFVAAFNTKDSEVPKAVVASLGKHSIKVDTGNLTPATFRYLVDLRCPLHLPVTACKHLIHIFSEEHGRERGVLDVFRTLQCCNLVSLDLQLCYWIPASAWQTLHGANWPNLKKANFSECFHGDTPGADGAAGLLQALSQSTQLEDLDLRICSRIPAAAWQKLHGAKWLNLKKANFTRCFGSGTKGADGAADLLEALSQSSLLEELNFNRCSKIPAGAWQKLHGAKWLNLKKADFFWCFDEDTQGAVGAPHLLQALSQSTLLEELNFAFCSQIPAAAWQQLPDGAWQKLREAFGIPEEELQRLQLKGEDAKCWTPSTSTLEIAADDSVALAGPRRLKTAVARDLDSDVMEPMALLSSSPIEVLDLRNCPRIPAAAWQQLHGVKWLNLKKADFCQCFYEDTQGADGAADLLEALSQSSLLEELNIGGCSQIPAGAWQKLHGAKWLNLKKADFRWCFGSGTQGADGAADLIEALRHSPLLEELDLSWCSQIPAAAWQKLHGAKWLNLKKANFTRCFNTDTKGADAAAGLLEALSQSSLLEELNIGGCSQIPAGAWQKLHGAKWLNLTKADFRSCFNEETQGADGAPHLLQALSQSSLLEELNIDGCSQIPAGAWQKLHGAKWLNLKKADFGSCFNKDAQGADGAAGLLEALSHSRLLEWLYFKDCSQIPAAAWQKLHGAKWLHLKTANFHGCFNKDTKGAEGAADLLEALRQSTQLEELDFAGCSQIPAAAWHQLPDGAWPKLRRAHGIPDKELRRLRGHGELEG